jgi:hypothetical protein
VSDTHQLLTHTAGFDEKFAGGLRWRPSTCSRSRRPAAIAHQAIHGALLSYGSTNYAVAGWLLETEAAAMRGGDRARLFRRSMSATTARQPSRAAHSPVASMATRGTARGITRSPSAIRKPVPLARSAPRPPN